MSILALAQHALQHPAEAQNALTEATQLITQLKANPDSKGHHDLRIAGILFHEAEAKIKVSDGPTESQ